ncbi:MAG: hypothetical protein AB1705_22285, partial [Verrucomicrobiota bacterium]
SRSNVGALVAQSLAPKTMRLPVSESRRARSDIIARDSGGPSGWAHALSPSNIPATQNSHPARATSWPRLPFAKTEFTRFPCSALF